MRRTLLAVIFTVLFAVLLGAGARWFINARSDTASKPCVMHLREIAGVKEHWGLDHSKTADDVPTWDDLRPYMPSGGGDSMLHCPSGGVYTIGRLGEPPKCSIGGRDHSLPPYSSNGTSKN